MKTWRPLKKKWPPLLHFQKAVCYSALTSPNPPMPPRFGTTVPWRWSPSMTPLLLPPLPCTMTGGKTMSNAPTTGRAVQGMVWEGTLAMPRRTSQVALFTTWTTLMPPKQDWSEAWELPPMEGVMLPTDDLEEGALGLVSGADASSLLLSSLQFNSMFRLWLVIDCWTSSVTSLPYALDLDFITLQIAVVLNHSVFSVP